MFNKFILILLFTSFFIPSLSSAQKSNLDNDEEDFVTVVQASQASSTELVGGDFDALSTTEAIDANERKDITDVTTSSYLTFYLNTKGKTSIDKTGITKLALREGHDILNTAFTGNASEYNYLHLRSSEYTGTSFDPILEISYVTTLPEPSKIQDFEYAYDNNGNITTINDHSLQVSSDPTLSRNYTYDDLNRMLSATATNLAGSQNIYTSTYTYNSVGNITLLRQGSAGQATSLYYTYGGTSYANPHAVTSIGPITFTYDNNGNLTNDEVWTHTYNYDNRLTQSTDGTNTTTYIYDPNGQRIKTVTPTLTTIYPTKYYNKEGSTDVKHIYAGDMLIATVRGTGSSAVVSYVHTDHLNSTDKVTNANAELTEVSDYYPYGSQRISTTYVGTNEQRKFIGQEFDSSTNLSYLNARYYDGGRGQFLSQDPVYLALGSPKNLKSLGVEQNAVLRDPQMMNSYSYARGNPIVNKDPTGKYWEVSLSGTTMGLSGSLGVRFDSSGLNLVASGGAGIGAAGFPLSVSYNSEKLPHTIESNVTIGGGLAYIVGFGISKNGEYQPLAYNLKNPSTEKSFIVGLGADAYVRKEYSIPILGGETKTNNTSTPTKSQYLNNKSESSSSKTTNSMISNDMYSALKANSSFVMKTLQGIQGNNKINN